MSTVASDRGVKLMRDSKVIDLLNWWKQAVQSDRVLVLRRETVVDTVQAPAATATKKRMSKTPKSTAKPQMPEGAGAMPEEAAPLPPPEEPAPMPPNQELLDPAGDWLQVDTRTQTDDNWPEQDLVALYGAIFDSLLSLVSQAKQQSPASFDFSALDDALSTEFNYKDTDAKLQLLNDFNKSTRTLTDATQARLGVDQMSK